MSDHIRLVASRPPLTLLYENGAAFGRNGVTWFENYEPQDAPAVRPRGAVSRYQVPNAVAMPINRATGIALCDRLAGLLPKLSDEQAHSLARRVRGLNDDWGDKSSLLRTGYRAGQVRAVELDARKMVDARKMIER